MLESLGRIYFAYLTSHVSLWEYYQPIMTAFMTKQFNAALLCVMMNYMKGCEIHIFMRMCMWECDVGAA
jgi:hypothetical protein